jgi:hypothetical protein
MEEGNIPGKSTVEVSTQSHKPDNPLAELGRGCDSIDADNIFGEPLGQEMNTVWEEEPLDLETSTFDSETDEVVNDLEFSPGFTVDDDIMPI